MKKAKILVVEDDAVIALELESRLQSMGYEVVAKISSGEEAIVKLPELKPDLTLMDIRLKGAMDGIDTATVFRTIRDIPIIYLTAFDDERTLERAKVTAPYGYILKPFDERELRPTVEMALFKHDMEKRLKENQELLSTTLQSIGDAVLSTDAELKIRFMNPVAEKLTGFKLSEALEKHLKDIFKIEFTGWKFYTSQKLNNELRRKLIKEIKGSKTLTSQEGIVRYINVNLAPIEDIGNTINGFVLTFQDITEKKKAEEALRASEEKFSKAFRSSPGSIILSRVKDDTYIEVNESFLNTTGYTREEVIGCNYSNINFWVNTHDRVVFMKTLQQEKAVRNYEAQFRKKNGETGWAAISAELIEMGGELLVLSVANDITERKKAEQALAQSEKMYRQIAENAVDIIYTTDLNGNFIYVNEAGIKTSGYSINELRNKNYLNLVLPEYKEKVKRFFLRQYLSKKSTSYLEFPFQTKNKEIKWYAQNSTVVLENGKVSGFHIIARDITERKKAEDALKESEERYRLLFESNPHPMFVYDSKTLAFLDVNIAAIDHYGYTKKEFLNMTIKDIRPKEDIPVLMENIRKTKDGLENAGEWRHRKKNGNVINVEIRSHSIEFLGKNARVVLANDITERKRAEQALIETNATLRALIKASPLAIQYLDPSGIVKIWNPAAEQMFGWTEEEIVGKPNPLVTENILQEVQSLQPQALKEGVVMGVELSRKRKNGTSINISLSTAPVRDAGGKIVGAMSLMLDITEKKKAEQEIRKLLLAVRQSPVSIVITDTNGIIEYVNPKFETVTKYNAEEVAGKNLPLLISGELSAKEYDKILNKLLKDEVWHGEFKNKKKSGELFWESASISPVKNERGRITHFIALKEDVTEKKNALQLLAQSEERYRSMFEYSSAMMLIIDPDSGSIVGANKSASNFYGYSKEELLTLEIWDINVLSKNELLPKLQEIKKDSSQSFYSKHRLANGELRDIEVHTGGIKIDNKKLLYLILHDITERIKVEKELEDYRSHLEKLVEERTSKLHQANNKLQREVNKLKIAEEKILDQIVFLKILINTIPIPVFIRDKNKVYVDCNKAFETFHGISKEQLVGKTVFDFSPPGIAKLHNKYDDEILMDRGEQMYETATVDTNGGEHEVIIYKATFEKTDGTVEGIVGVVFDITPQKKMQKEIKRALDKEKDLSDLKSRFISTASHEFRTPLTSILASADLLEMFGQKWKKDKFDEHVAKIQTAVGYMTELINDVLTVSRSETGIQKFAPEKINLFELCKRVFEEVKFSAKGEFEFEFKYDIDETSFQLDNKLLTQVLSNLLSNSVKYSPSGGTIMFYVNRTDAKLVFMISDEGIGIPEEDKKRLFEPFNRGQNIGNISGTGLGLSIVKKAVELQNGEIEFESQLGKGTKFRIILPIK